MTNLENIINNFSAISLNRMDNVKLMNRVDIKFAFNYNKFPKLLERLQEYYFILEINGKRQHSYKSLYFDTDNRKFYHDHHNSRVNRNKVRFREYVDSGGTFLEVKLKNNKGKTIKKRMRVQDMNTTLSTEQEKYISQIIGRPLDIKPKQWIDFTRMTFVHKIKKERMTIDIDLCFEDISKKQDNLKEIIIAEVKQERMSRSSDFIRIAKEMSIFPFRLSKYCMSTIHLEPSIKQNRFKKKLLFINKLKS
ncbi:MAG: polyphosphate polymerase domain-containing protein [Bacteroidota bacterium]|nr:polyphosphate polymerase domain-containing protein [Bacteroidota bacterium]